MRPGLFVLDARLYAEKRLDKVTRLSYSTNMLKNIVAHLYIQRAFESDPQIRQDIADAILLVMARSKAATNWIRRWAV
jgi:hypothetical protein